MPYQLHPTTLPHHTTCTKPTATAPICSLVAICSLLPLSIHLSLSLSSSLPPFPLPSLSALPSLFPLSGSLYLCAVTAHGTDPDVSPPLSLCRWGVPLCSPLLSSPLLSSPLLSSWCCVYFALLSEGRTPVFRQTNERCLGEQGPK